jgi:hypothetical protein
VFAYFCQRLQERFDFNVLKRPLQFFFSIGTHGLSRAEADKEGRHAGPS